MASRCGRFSDPNTCISYSEDLSSRRFPASTFCSRLGADVGSLVFGQRSADDAASSRPNASMRSPPIKSSCFAVYFIGVGPCLIPSSSALCCPRNETGILQALNAKKNVSTMKTERSYHPQNRFETKRRLLALPQKIVWIVVCIVALKAIGVSEELTAILVLFAFVYIIRATLQIAFRLLLFLIRWICIAAALAWVVCRLLL